jgi:hypothetical protein
MRKFILGLMLMMSVLTVYAQQKTKVSMMSYITPIGKDSNENFITSRQPIKLAVIIKNEGPVEITPKDTMYFRYVVDYRYWRTNGHLYQNGKIYQKAISTRVTLERATYFVLDTLVIEDSCLREQDPVMGPTQHRIGICLWSCKKISDTTNIGFNYGLYFLHKTTTEVKNIVKSEDLKIIGYYDMAGRKVDYIEPNQPYVIIYNNGKRQKVIRIK